LNLSGQKLLFVFLGSELGGAEWQGLLLARYLKERCGAAVVVFGLGAGGPGRVAGVCAKFGLVWRAVPFSFNGSCFAKFRALRLLARQVRKVRPTALFAYTWLPNVACGLVWRFTGAKAYIWNQRDEGRDLNQSLLHRIAVRLTTCFVANATNGRDFLVKMYGVNAECCSVIHNGIVQPLLEAGRDAYRRAFGIPENALVVCMVGNLHRNKDHATLLQAWRIVLDRVSDSDSSLILMLAGRFDEQAQSLLRLAENLNLGAHVRFCGELQNVAELLCATDVYVHSSPREGLPNGVLEAMAVGLPVVGTRIPGIEEALGEEMLGCLAPPGDAEALADKIADMIGDAARRSACGAANRLRIVKEFSLEKMGANYIAILQGGLAS
jgi:glycosyltransferase involved in cell wall biosynthesis